MFLHILISMKKILTEIPARTIKPRENGITMVMDKGKSIREAEDFLSVNQKYTDIIKLGFGTSIITPNIADKIKIYQKEEILVYTGGTLFEAFAIRNQLDDYKRYMNSLNLNIVEISDGSMTLNHEKKCEMIAEFSKDFIVISEVGSKDPGIKMHNIDWVKCMQNELSAGSWKIIAEARESGNVGIYNDDGEIKSDIVNTIMQKMPADKIIWEAPSKDQQTWFIKQYGANINLGNISPCDVIPLECLRIGLRSDTFDNFLT